MLGFASDNLLVSLGAVKIRVVDRKRNKKLYFKAITMTLMRKIIRMMDT